MLGRSPGEDNFIFTKDYIITLEDSEESENGNENLTLIPLPSLQIVDAVSMNDNCRDFIFIDCVNIPSSFRRKSFSCIA